MDTRSLCNLLFRDLTREPSGTGRAIPPIAWASTRGPIRNENQDRVLVARSPNGLVIAVVADGMGGMRDGSRAAALSTAAVAAHCMLSRRSKPEAMLADALNFANEQVFKDLHGDGGAALAVVASSAAGRHIAHAGDTRVYQLGNDGILSQLTVDDTFAGQLECLGRSSKPPRHPDSRLIQFVGLGPDLEPHVRSVPPDGRALLMATDGIYGVPSPVLEWVIEAADGLQSLTQRLILLSEWSGGHDNATAVAFSLGDETQEPPRQLEFWMPHKHLVLVPTPGPIVPPAKEDPRVHDQPSSTIRKHRRKKSRRTPRKAPPASPSPPVCDLPIVTFGDTATTNDTLATGDTPAPEDTLPTEERSTTEDISTTEEHSTAGDIPTTDDSPSLGQHVDTRTQADDGDEPPPK